MVTKRIYQSIKASRQKSQKQFVILIDPDKMDSVDLESTLLLAQEAKVDYIFVGGSLIVNDMLDYCVQTIKQKTNIPVILFPGNAFQLSYQADALLFLSLISGRNPDLLIGQHVISAPYLKSSNLEIIPTGYMLIDGGVPTTVTYISNTTPIPANKKDVALCTAMAGEMLGLKMIYMDAGSGAQNAISEEMIRTVSENIDIPLIIGGGIRTPEKALANVKAGADVIVVGNAIEKDPTLLLEMAAAVHSLNPVQETF
jgi:putative glycerol-1-phosphate prenyltransferase